MHFQRVASPYRGSGSEPILMLGGNFQLQRNRLAVASQDCFEHQVQVSDVTLDRNDRNIQVNLSVRQSVKRNHSH